MSDPLRFDDEASRAVEAVYSTPDVIEQRRIVLEALDLDEGERVLDLGVGPGFLAGEMAAEVGPRGRVSGIDISTSMLALARRRGTDEDCAPIELGEGDVTALEFPDASFDAAVATQVYEYVENLPAALAEACRVLAPGGRLVVLDTDWDSIVWHSSDDRRMARVLLAWDEHLVHRDLPRRLPRMLAESGLRLQSCVVVPLLNLGYELETYSGGTLELIARFVAGRGGVSPPEARAWAEDLRELGPDYFFSLSRFMFVAVK